MFRPTEQQAAAAAGDDEVVDFLGARVYVDVQIPRTSYRGKMRIVSRRETFELKAAARKFFEQQGMPLDNHAAFGGEEWTNEIATRMLAIAVRNPKDVSLQLADLAEWRELDDDQIDALWIRYQDEATRIDPIGHKRDLTEQEVMAIERAAKKGEAEVLMSFGSPKLARYVMRSLTERPTS